MEIEAENLSIWLGQGLWIKVVVITFEVEEQNIWNLNLHYSIKISPSLWIKSWSQRLLPAVVLLLNTSPSPICRNYPFLWTHSRMKAADKSSKTWKIIALLILMPLQLPSPRPESLYNSESQRLIKLCHRFTVTPSAHINYFSKQNKKFSS